MMLPARPVSRVPPVGSQDQPVPSLAVVQDAASLPGIICDDRRHPELVNQEPVASWRHHASS